MKLIQKFLKTLMLFLVFNVYHSDAQSDTILFRNIGYVIENQVSYGNLKIFDTGFCFTSQSMNPIQFKQDYISLKKHKVISSSNQIQFQDLASPNYSLEFESEKQMNFLIQIIKSKRKKKNNLLIENIARNIAGEYIKRSLYNFR